MSHSLVFQLLIVMLFGLVSGEILQKNCSENTDGRSLSCYTCLGRDQINCERGLTCCMGSCFKLVDLDHDLIVKGCVNEDEEDASMKVRTLDINLYWANGEKVKGESYFCKGKDFCNAASIVSLIICTTALPTFLFMF